MNKVEHLLKLADEYQAKAVYNHCVKFLKDEPKSKENAMKILFLASGTVIAKEDKRLDSVRSKCYELINNIELTDILENNDFKSFDRETSENVIVQKAERLEVFLKGVYPQLIGLAEYALWMCLDPSVRSILTPCPQHFSNKKSNEDLPERIKSCSVCKRMILQLASSSRSGSYRSSSHHYGGSYHFDDKLVSIIQDFQNILSL